MLGQYLIAFREAFEAALIVAIMLPFTIWVYRKARWKDEKCMRFMLL